MTSSRPALPPATETVGVARPGAGKWREAAALIAGAAVAAVAYVTWSGRSEPSRPIAAPATASQPAPEGPRTPGALEMTPIELPQPAYNQNDDICHTARSEWTFPGSDAAGVRARLSSAGFDAATQEALLAHLRCDASGCALDAPDPLLRSLPATPRGRLYRDIAAFRGQMFSVIPYRRAGTFAPWAQVARSPRVQALFNELSWREGDASYFADVATACRALTDTVERVEMLSLLRRRYSLDVRVRVDASTDPAAVARYWTLGDAPPSPGLIAQVRDAQRDGRALPLRELLSGWAREKLNAFPGESSPERDCFWSTLHFDAPDAERFPAPTPGVFAAELSARWREVPRESLRYGDAIVLMGATEPEHAMIYLANDLVFTKNGRMRSRAWVIEHLAEVLAEYPRIASVRFYRRAS